MKAAAVAAANSRFSKIVRSSIGARWCFSISTKSGSSTTPATIPPIVSGSAQPFRPAAREPEHEPGQAGHEHQHAGDVVAADAVGLGQLAQHEAAPTASRAARTAR